MVEQANKHDENDETTPQHENIDRNIRIDNEILKNYCNRST